LASLKKKKKKEKNKKCKNDLNPGITVWALNKRLGYPNKTLNREEA